MIHFGLNKSCVHVIKLYNLRIMNSRCFYIRGHRMLLAIGKNPSMIGKRTLTTSNRLLMSENSKRNPKTFASLFRDSPYCKIGSPEGKIVIGKIFAVVDEDLYIDFGFKFHAVCRKPKQNSHNYARGATVRVRINDLELSDRFLGSKQDMTLLEADVTLLGLVSSPVTGVPKKSGTDQSSSLPTSKIERIVSSSSKSL